MPIDVFEIHINGNLVRYGDVQAQVVRCHDYIQICRFSKLAKELKVVLPGKTHKVRYKV